MTAPAVKHRMIFAGGGTGGHLYPAIAIADRVRELLEENQVEIMFVGTKRGLEYRLGDALGYPLTLINIRGITRSFTVKNLMVPFLVLSALVKASGLLNKFMPDVVVGTGGYVSWPVLHAAAKKSITTVLQEQNSFPGVTTRKLARRADRIYLGFEKAREYLQTSAEIKVTGNPVRRSLMSGNREEALAKFKLHPEKKTILIMGGSQGARAINNAVVEGLKEKKLPENYQLLWLTGKRDHKEVTSAVGSQITSLFPFEKRMDLVYAVADMVISRAGALALAEFEACRLPSLLVPYPHAAGDHQRHNARQFVEQGWAQSVDETDLARVRLLEEALGMFESGQVNEMRKKIQEDTAGKKPAVDIIAEDIIGLLKAGKSGGDN